jgi:hypothetical protein
LKRFFFKKKKQKTFARWARGFGTANARKEQKFFAPLFFKKAAAYFAC